MSAPIQKIQYSRLDVVLATPRVQGGSPMRQLLSDLEFRGIRMVSSVADLRHAVETRTPDLIVAEEHKLEGDLCGVIRDIRNGTLGDNVFTAVIIATWQPSEELIRRTADAGADDIMVQPFSRSDIGDRVSILLKNRKPFVVTSTYIGPDRRKGGARGPSSKPLIEVPNFLMAKARGEYNPEEFKNEISFAFEAIKNERIIELANSIHAECKLVLKGCEGLTNAEFVTPKLIKITKQSNELLFRLTQTPHSTILKLCKTLCSVLERLRKANPNIDQRDVSLLPEIALSIVLGLEDSLGSPDGKSSILEEINESLVNVKTA